MKRYTGSVKGGVIPQNLREQAADLLIFPPLREREKCSREREKKEGKEGCPGAHTGNPRLKCNARIKANKV